MGWTSSLLGSNQVSSYLHIDNLRNDLTAGKFWNASDGTETLFAQIGHSGGNGFVSVSSGDLSICPASGKCNVYDDALGTATQYTGIQHDGTRGLIDTSTGELRLQSVSSSNVVQVGNATTGGKIRFWDTALGAFRYFTIQNGAVVITTS
jgi:hypothetical protein